jgi:amino acid transporter
VGVQLPAIFIVAFIPMILVAFAYRELNADSPDSGTTFTWTTKAFGPFVGWMGGWGLLAANIIVLSNLAGVAVDFFYLFLAQVFNNPELADLTSNTALNIATCLTFVALAVWVSYRGLHTTKLVQYSLVGFQVVVLGVFMASWRSRTQHGDVRSVPRVQLGLVQPRQNRELRAVHRRHVTRRLRLLGLGRVPDRE